MKKLLVFSLVLLFSLSACNKHQKDAQKTNAKPRVVTKTTNGGHK